MLASLVNFFNPHRIVMTGGVARRGDPLPASLGRARTALPDDVAAALQPGVPRRAELLQTVSEQKADYGAFTLKNFAIVDEENVAQILNNDQQSRAMISRIFASILGRSSGVKGSSRAKS